MNSIKLYSDGNGNFVLQVSSEIQYHILNGAVVKSNIITDNLEEAVFDISVQLNIANAISCSPNLVTGMDTLKLIMALIQEKIEDFD